MAKCLYCKKNFLVKEVDNYSVISIHGKSGKLANKKYRFCCPEHLLRWLIKEMTDKETSEQVTFDTDDIYPSPV